jgi:hypothetical protein
MEKLAKLIEKYEALHPELETPLNYLNVLGAEQLEELLGKALKENLVLQYIEPSENTLDGGEVTLIKKP